MSFDKRKFLHPENAFSPSFFWLWNDKLDFEVLRGQIDDMLVHGMRALCLHPFPKDFRPGTMPSKMEPDYLTPEYMKVLGKVLDYACEKKMHVWLYDEGGWPSGSACGKVIAADEKRFTARTVEKDDGGIPAVKLTTYHPELEAPYPSVIEKGATELFIELTHEKFRKHFAHHFGKTLKFTFTDEPSMPLYWPGVSLAWCDDFAEEFKRRKGYDITPHLPELLNDDGKPGRKLQQIRVDYCDVRADLFLERYMLPIRNWCHAHRLLSGGHLNGEDQPLGNTFFGYGHILRALRAFDVPGVDVIWRQIYPDKDKLDYVQRGSADFENHPFNTPFAKYASSAAHQNGSRYVMAEALAVYGDGIPPGCIRWVIDYLIVRGITVFVFSGFPMSNRGSLMASPGIHFGNHHPYWEFMKPMMQYTERLCGMMSQSKPAVKSALYFNIRALWAGGHDMDRANARHFKFSELLLRNCGDFDYVDDEQIADARVMPDGKLRIGRMTYEALVIPYGKWMAAQAAEKVAALKQKGFPVLESEKAVKLSAPRTCRVMPAGDIRVCKRIKGQQAVYFFTNESTHTRKVHIVLDEPGNIVRCDPESGTYIEVPSAQGGFDWTFSAMESALFLTGVTAEEAAPPEAGRVRFSFRDGWTLQKKRSCAVGKEDFVITAYPDEPEIDGTLGDWSGYFGKEFSGTVLYRREFDSRTAFEGELDLGAVKHCAKVFFNDRELSGKFFAPFRWRVKVRSGRNRLEILVGNSLLNAVCPAHVREYLRTAFPPESPYERRFEEFTRDGIESGLFGPVVIRTLKHKDLQQ